MKSTHLRTFLAVATVGSFSAAARRVHVSQSTASLHVKELEADVGVQLLDRTRDGVVPTAAGRVMMRYAHQLLGLEREAVTDVRAHADLAVDALHVAASTVLGDVHLPPVLAAFANAWPNVQVAMRVTGSAAALTALRLGDVEVAFLGQRPTGDGRRATGDDLVVRSLADDEMVMVAASSMPAPDASNLRWVARELGSASRSSVASLIPDGCRPVVTVGSAEGVRQCVLEGVGVAFMSRVAVANDLAARRLRVVPWPGTPLRRSLVVARLAAVAPSIAATAFIELACERMAAPRRSAAS